MKKTVDKPAEKTREKIVLVKLIFAVDIPEYNESKCLLQKYNLTNKNVQTVSDLNMKKYLYNYLGLEPNDIYKEKTITNIDSRLRELSFLAIEKATAISFTSKGVILHLFINNKKASTFNGVVGVLPNNTASATATQQKPKP